MPRWSIQHRGTTLKNYLLLTFKGKIKTRRTPSPIVNPLRSLLRTQGEPWGRKPCRLKCRGRKRPGRGSRQPAVQAERRSKSGLDFVRWGRLRGRESLKPSKKPNLSRFNRSHERHRSELYFSNRMAVSTIKMNFQGFGILI